MYILISACLLGISCRYDGGSKEYKDISNISKQTEKISLVPFCPECYGGLATPREPCEIINSHAVTKLGEDKTQQYINGANEALGLCKKLGIKIAILESKSPSCGYRKIYDGSFSKKLVDGNGFTAKLLSDNGIVIFSEDELHEFYNYIDKNGDLND